jgi:hypothetical protein
LYPTLNRYAGYGIDKLKRDAFLSVTSSNRAAEEISRSEFAAKVLPLLLFPNVQALRQLPRRRSKTDVAQMGQARPHRIRKFPRKRRITCDFVEIFKWQKADRTRCRGFGSNNLAIPLSGEKHNSCTKNNQSTDRSRGSEFGVAL